ncbi:lipopolysaccharide biosynthesis protein [Thalassoroseus pseudoceratinae]|uniref:lipopolysaccharide biosynthesis protein n=1 Tax=Thalassoroseus pseudoceratinae TaxID=2713176 RepID=UPI00141E65A7|nr:lipopolysaccharide biosynthesis protein [Thalassoroseus pseudoceratinae]
MTTVSGSTAQTPNKLSIAYFRTAIRKLVSSESISKGACAIMDQAVTSAGRFISTILVGRACGVEGLGLYSLGISVAMITLAAQHSLITAPYTVYLHKRSSQRERSSYAGSMLIAWLTLACVIGTLFLTTSATIPHLHADSTYTKLFAVLALGVPALLLREFARQLTFANSQFKTALLFDSVTAFLQVIALLILTTTNRLSPIGAWWAIISVYSLTSAVWLLHRRGSINLRYSEFWSDLKQNWSIGRWDLASNVFMTSQLYLMHWCLAWSVGVQETGVYAACATVLLFANPLVMGISNFIMPMISRTLCNDGLQAMTRVVLRATLVLGTIMLSFSAVAILMGPMILQILFQIDSNNTHRIVIALLAANATIGAFGIAPEWALLALEKPQVTFRAACIGLATTGLAAVTMIQAWGVVGAALGLLLGTLLSVSYIWMAYRLVLQDDRESRGHS